MADQGLLAALLGGRVGFGPSGVASTASGGYGNQPPEPWQRRVNQVSGHLADELSTDTIQSNFERWGDRDEMEQALKEREEYIRELELILERYQPPYHTRGR